MDTLLQDLRYALRQLTKSPGFTTVAVVTLALGIGANTSMFTLVNGVLLRPLVYEESDSLFGLAEQNPQLGPQAIRPASYPTYLDWRAERDLFDGLAYAHGNGLLYRGPEGPENILVGFVTDEFFRTMRTPPALGRVLPDEGGPGGPAGAVISHRFWLRRFAKDPAVLGTPLTLGRMTFTVLGVMPPGFQYPSWAEVWVPIESFEAAGGNRILSQRGFHADSRVVARLRRDVTSSQAQDRMNTLARTIAARHPNENAGWTAVSWRSMTEQLFGPTTASMLQALMATVGLVLVIACVNLANLSVTRALGRSREMAVRSALGASRWRLGRQVLTEALVLGVMGGAAGVGLASLALGLTRNGWLVAILPRLEEVRLDGGVLAFAAAVTGLAVVGFGVLPAVRAGDRNLAVAVREGARSVGFGRATGRLRSALLAVQLALTIVVMAGAGLLVKSLWRLTQVDLGYTPERVVSVRVPADKYSAADVYPFFERIAASLSQVDGVQSVGFANGGLPVRLVPEGHASESGREETASYRVVSAGFFPTLGMSVSEGRGISAEDLRRPGRPVVVINEALARRYWPRESPVGRRLSLVRMSQGRADFGRPFSAEIIGVVRDARWQPAADPQPELYLPFSVNPWQWASFNIRTRSDSARLIPELRRAVLAVDPDVPVAGLNGGFVTMERGWARAIAPQRLTTGVFAAFAAMAFFLGIVGVYGVTSNLARLRVGEISVRLALGARQGTVVGLIVRQGLLPVAVGGVVGLAAAFATTRLLQALLFGVGATDPVTFVGVALAMAAAAMAATYLPARRAAQTDPMIALRSD